MKKLIISIGILIIIIISGTILKKNLLIEKTGITKGAQTSIIGNNLYKATLSIDNMWCPSCAVGAEYNLKAIDGVINAHIGFTENSPSQGWLVYEKNKVTKEQIIKAIKPYKTTIVSDIVYNKIK